MNILYCGDIGIIDGLIISILSLLKTTNKPFNIYVLTMKYENTAKKFTPMPESYIKELDKIVKKTNKDNSVTLIDITDIANQCLPEANIDTRFTPYCMLRLYADQIKELPSKILYLDNDIVALKSIEALYAIDMSNYDIAGVLDYYGSHFFNQKMYRKDYLNSGVLLLNLDNIRKSKLFEAARVRCQKNKMFMPDQTALNLLSTKKLIISNIYNEQKTIHPDTVIRHFTTTFKFWPTVHTQTIKPWHIDLLHDTLKIHEFDDVLEEYQKIIKKIKK